MTVTSSILLYCSVSCQFRNIAATTIPAPSSNVEIIGKKWIWRPSHLWILILAVYHRNTVVPPVIAIKSYYQYLASVHQVQYQCLAMFTRMETVAYERRRYNWHYRYSQCQYQWPYTDRSWYASWADGAYTCRYEYIVCNSIAMAMASIMKL